jgi:hypothetical protein
MKRIVLSLLTAGAAAVAVAQAPASAAAAPGVQASAGIGVIILSVYSIGLGKRPGEEALRPEERRPRQVEKRRDLVQKLNDQGQSMPPAKREALEKQADDKQAWKDAGTPSAICRRPSGALENRIGPIVKDYFGKALLLVLDARAGIIYADEIVDVTTTS